MKEKIKLLKEMFKLDENDLERRKEALKKVSPYADEIMDSFYEKILQKEVLAEYIDKDTIDVLKKKQIAFIVDLLSLPFDEKLYKKIAKVGVVHYHIRLDPLLMSYGYHVLSELILNQSQKDPTLLPYLKLIIKYLKVAKEIMTNEYFAQKRAEENPYKADDLFLALNRLYLAFILYEETMEKYKPSKEAQESFLQSIEELRIYKKVLDAVDVNLSTLKRFHTEFINEMTQESFMHLKNALQKPLNDLSVTAYLSTTSAAAMLRDMSLIVYHKLLEKEELTPQEIRHNVMTLLGENFGWAIEKIMISKEESSQEWAITKHLMYKETIYYLYVDFKPISNKLYIVQMVDLLCETIKTTLYLKHTS